MSANNPKHHIPNQSKKTPGKPGITLSQQTHYQGPIPSADELGKYEQVYPGFANRIMEMAEMEQRERIALNKSSTEKVFEVERSKLSITKRGQWFALCIIVLILLLAAFMVYVGSPLSATTLVGAVVVGTIWAFMGIRKNSKSIDR